VSFTCHLVSFTSCLVSSFGRKSGSPASGRRLPDRVRLHYRVLLASFGLDAHPCIGLVTVEPALPSASSRISSGREPPHRFLAKASTVRCAQYAPSTLLTSPTKRDRLLSGSLCVRACRASSTFTTSGKSDARRIGGSPGSSGYCLSNSYFSSMPLRRKPFWLFLREGSTLAGLDLESPTCLGGLDLGRLEGLARNACAAR
jgi:hypothetical protein